MQFPVRNPRKHIIPAMCLLMLLFSSDLPAQAEWQPIEPSGAPAARCGLSMINLPDGRVLLFGGQDAQGSLLNDIYAFGNGDWAKLSPADEPPPMSGQSANLMPGDNTVFIFGGRTAEGYSNEIYEYNISADAFTVREPQGTKPPGRIDHNAFEDEGNLGVLGGRNESGQLNDFWYYDTQTNSWIQKTNAPHPVEKSCMWKKGDALVVYGAGKTQIFDPSSGTWSTAGTNTEYRTSVATAQIADKMYFIGGKVTNEGVTAKIAADTLYSSETLVYNTETSLVETAASLPYGIADAAAAAFLDPDDNKEKIMLFGGRKADGSLNTGTFVLTPEEESPVKEDNGPDNFYLFRNYPNPFNPGTVIEYRVNQPCRVKIIIFDVKGREIEILKDSYHTAGSYQAVFDASGLPSGLYFYKMEGGGFVNVRKMVKLQ